MVRDTADKTNGLESIAKAPARRPGPGFFARLTLLGLLVLLVIAVIGVIWVLPDFVNEPVPAAALVEPKKPDPPSESETSVELEKRNAERALREVLQLQAVMESQEVSVWGGKEYEQALLTMAEADAAFGKSGFKLAEQKYRDVRLVLDELEASKLDRFAVAMEQGAVALSAYDQEEAVRQFAIALALQPENENAKIGAERARVSTQLKSRLDNAEQAIAQGELETAQGHFESALELDPRSLAAQQGAEFVVDSLKNNKFMRLMTEALAAVQNRQFDVARNRLEAAGQIKPGSREMRDAQTRLQLAVQEDRISTHRSRALDFGRSERWSDAVNEYAAALAIDPQAQFAVLGLSRSQRLAELHEQLDKYLKTQKRFQSAAPRENARDLIDLLDNMEDKGPQLSTKHLQLARILELAETPVQVSIHSDGMTEVTINRVAVLGRFEATQVTLLPGEYVGRGHRAGFVDVRIVFQVKPGETSTPVVIQCEEKI